MCSKLQAATAPTCPPLLELPAGFLDEVPDDTGYGIQLVRDKKSGVIYLDPDPLFVQSLPQNDIKPTLFREADAANISVSAHKTKEQLAVVLRRALCPRLVAKLLQDDARPPAPHKSAPPPSGGSGRRRRITNQSVALGAAVVEQPPASVPVNTSELFCTVCGGERGADYRFCVYCGVFFGQTLKGELVKAKESDHVKTQVARKACDDGLGCGPLSRQISTASTDFPEEPCSRQTSIDSQF